MGNKTKGRRVMHRFIGSGLIVSLAFYLGLAGSGNASAQITVTNNPAIDAFVRSADPTHNYGAAGALSVSGPIATNSLGAQNGLLDSFLQFNVSGAVSSFNTAFGAGQWTISGITLGVTAQAPNNTVFNYGSGTFAVDWMGNNSWTEGTGTPASPGSTVINYGQESSLLNSNVDEALGTFNYDGATSGRMNLSLGLTPGFISEISTGSLVSLYMTATSNSTVGFTFNSENFGTASARPALILTAVAIPEPSTVVLVGVSCIVLAASGRRRRKSKHAAVD
jgi:hypothetical protein